ncbi:DNA-directed DNA polymerase delta subunit POL31 [Sporobolomyces koalae]|uniref:DNA-directed DNA polymerase delta subunit POL31 n=1 Tax=Sporobolomyces koalae TaxID=500713 RepID=UPI00316CAE5C
MPARKRFEPHLTSATDPSEPRSFVTDSNDKQFSKQYANLYWLRLVMLRQRVKQTANEKWGNGKLQGVETAPKHVERLLEVQNGQLCWVLGTLYVDMPLKPNVLEDLAKDHHITAPPIRRKYHSRSDEIMLEDESGRVRLVGQKIVDHAGSFVTGTIVACLGAETSAGDFEVFEYVYAGLPDQPTRPCPKTGDSSGEWIAIVSGLEMGNSQAVGDLRTELLAEWLNGELGDENDAEEAVKVSRLVLAGNSLARPDLTVIDDTKKKRYGYDSSLYSSKPTEALDRFLSQLCQSLPVDLMPGQTDPTAPTMPQQALHPAMLPSAAGWDNFEGRTNPWWFDVNGTTFLGTSGQTIDDIFKYLESEDRLSIAQQTLEWSHLAPTCPDTLWCYPFTDRDPFILSQLPHVYFIGNQPKFETRLIEKPFQGENGKVAADEDQSTGKQVRIVLVPKFNETGQVVLVNSETLEVKVVKFEV